MATQAQYPSAVAIYPLMGIEAARHRSGISGAWRVWALAKALDLQGLGMIRRDDLRAFVLSLGVNRRTWERWIIEARTNGFVIDIQKGPAWWLILPSAARVAEAMKLENVGGRKVIIPTAALIGNGWRARVYTAWEHGKQISREQIQKAVNVPVRTQRYRGAQVELTRERNYSKSTLRHDSIAGVREFTRHKAPFVSGNGFIYWRLPDKRQAEHAQPGARGRARKINRSIRAINQTGLSLMRQALSNDCTRLEWIRLFNLTEAQRRQSERRAAKQDRRIDELYQRAYDTARGSVVWAHCPIG